MRWFRLALYFVLGLMLGGVTVTAFAATGPSRYGSSVNFNYPNGLDLRRPRSGPIYDFESAPDGWGHMRDINKMSIGGRDVDIDGIRKFSPGKLANLGVGLAKALGPLGIGLTLAPLIWDAVEEQWRKIQEYEDGKEWALPASGNYPASGWHPSKQAALDKIYESAPPQGDCSDGKNRPYQFKTEISAGGGTGYVKYNTCWYPGVWQTNYSGIFQSREPQGAATVPADDVDIQDAIYAELVARGMGSELARRLIDAGYTPTPDEITADGPSTIDGGTTTTTSSDPSGITTTTTTTHYDLSYSPGPGGDIGTGHATVGIIRRTETTKTNPDGSIESHSSTDAPPSGGVSTQPEADPEPPPDVCEQNPDASGCAPLGDPQDDQQVETEQRNIGMLDYATVNGTCPQPLTFSVAGYTHEISYQFICDGAVALRPLVIALGMLGAGLFMFGTLGSRKF